MRDCTESYLTEAFRKLSLLEADFDFTSQDVGKADELKSFVADDIDAPEEDEIIDVEAEKDADLQDSYVGKVIMECDCCHTRLYKNEEDIHVDEETGLANMDEECPVCNGTFGYKVIGKIEPFDAEASFEDPIEDEVEGEDEIEGDEIEAEDDVDFSDEEFKEALNDVAEKDVEKLTHSNLDEGCHKMNEDDVCPDCGKNPCVCDKEKVEEELLDHGNDNFGLSDFVAVDDDKSLEDDQADLVHCPCEDVPAINEELIEEEEEKFPNPDKHEKVGEHKGVAIYKCSDCGKFAAKIDGKKVKKDSKKELEDAIDAKNESLEEGVQIDMNSHIVSSDSPDVNVDVNNGEVKITDGFGGEGEMIAPLEPAEADQIEAQIAPTEDELVDDAAELDALEGDGAIDDLGAEDDLGLDEVPAEGEEAPIEGEEIPEEEPGVDDEAIDDFDEESFNDMGESYLRRVYENVKSFVTEDVKLENNQLVVEGKITFESGKERNTTFVFENMTTTKRGKTLFEGHNDMFSKSNKSFSLKGSLVEKKFVGESLVYNYTASTINESNENETVKVCGKVKR